MIERSHLRGRVMLDVPVKESCKVDVERVTWASLQTASAHANTCTQTHSLHYACSCKDRCGPVLSAWHYSEMSQCKVNGASRNVRVGPAEETLMSTCSGLHSVEVNLEAWSFLAYVLGKQFSFKWLSAVLIIRPWVTHKTTHKNGFYNTKSNNWLWTSAVLQTSLL